MIRGIGPVYAKKMVKAFGDTVFDVIEAGADRLREVTGIGAVRARRITDAWAEQKIESSPRETENPSAVAAPAAPETQPRAGQDQPSQA